MKIKYLAHSAFLLTADDGTRIITDPYTPGHGLNYRPITGEADIVTVSHEHGDHNNTAAVKGNPVIFRDSGNAKGIDFKAVKTFHDESGGSERGTNTVFVFKVDGMTIAHLGDLGHVLTDEQVKEIGAVDIVLLPVGGYYTIDANRAADNAKRINARVIIPMHYKTNACSMPIQAVDIFLTVRTNVTKTKLSEITLTAGELPKTPQIMVLEPAL